MPYIRYDVPSVTIGNVNESIRVMTRFDRHGNLRRISFICESAFDRERRLNGRKSRGVRFGVP